MNGLGDRIKKRRLERGMSLEDVAAATGVARQTIYKYECGIIKDIPYSKIIGLASTLRCSPAYLFGWTDDPYDYELDPEGRLVSIPSDEYKALHDRYNGNKEKIWAAWFDIESLKFFSKLESISYDEQNMILKHRALDEHGAKVVDTILDMELERCKDELKESINGVTEDNVIVLRFSEYKASAGCGAYLGPEAFKDLKVKATDLTKRADFCVQVTGNSMEPSYHNGDLLLVECMLDISVGEIGIFTLDGEAYVKKRGESDLISLNPEYESIPFDETVRCNGLVIGVLDPKLIVEK